MRIKAETDGAWPSHRLYQLHTSSANHTSHGTGTGTMVGTQGTHQALLLSLLLASTSAIKVYSDYGGGDYSSYKEEGEEREEKGGQWTGLGADHIGQGHGGLQHQHHYHSGAGSGNEGGSKTGSHIKQHVTKGYQDYHHKDEVGKTTHYIDSYGDSGDHYGSHGAKADWAQDTGTAQHRDHHVSGFAGQQGASEKKSSQKKTSTKKKDDYKGNVADLIYAKKPVYSPKQSQQQESLRRYPQPYYFY